MIRLLCFFALFALIATASLQQGLDDFVLLPEGAPIRAIPYRGDPILVHLRIGHERAIAFPEPVTLNSTSGPALPGCEITVDGELVGFYPREGFTRRTFSLTGQLGTRYDLSIAPAVQVWPARSGCLILQMPYNLIIM